MTVRAFSLRNPPLKMSEDNRLDGEMSYMKVAVFEEI
jgi:hypothetical protein